MEVTGRALLSNRIRGPNSPQARLQQQQQQQQQQQEFDSSCSTMDDDARISQLESQMRHIQLDAAMDAPPSVFVLPSLQEQEPPVDEAVSGGAKLRRGLSARLSMTSKERREFGQALREKAERNKLLVSVSPKSSASESSPTSLSVGSSPLVSPSVSFGATSGFNNLSVETKSSPSSKLSTSKPSPSSLSPSKPSPSKGSPTKGSPSKLLSDHQLSEDSRFFVWRESQAQGFETFLFIAHDNTRLSDNLHSSSNRSSFRGMDIMLETRTSDGCTCFITGQIAHNGDWESVEKPEEECGTARGSYWLVCHNLRAVKAGLDAFTRRPSSANSEISEIDLQSAGSAAEVDFSSPAAISAFFGGCSAKVDVILDPIHSGHWYPYYENARKMAPQFRSKGIGYLRLGDDMSNFGAAFLSLDAGASYLDFGRVAVEISADLLPPPPRSSAGTRTLNKTMATSKSRSTLLDKSKFNKTV